MPEIIASLPWKGIILIALGSITLFVAIGNLIKKVMAKKWPSTQATLIDRSMKRSRKGYYSIKAKLSYEVNGKQYETSLDGAQSPDRFEADALNRMNEDYPIGREYVLYYSPSRPSESIVNRKLHWSDSVVFIFSAILLVLGFVTL